MRFFAFSLLIISFLACRNKQKKAPINVAVSMSDSLPECSIDDNFMVVVNGSNFSELSYLVLVYKRLTNDGKPVEKRTVISDSKNYKSIKPHVRFEDMDNDGKKDLMLLMANDGYGKKQYKLFSTKDEKLTEIKGFEDLYSPIYNEKKKAIVSNKGYPGIPLMAFHKIVNGVLVELKGAMTPSVFR